MKHSYYVFSTGTDFKPVTKESRLECKDEVLKEVIILLNKHIKASN